MGDTGSYPARPATGRVNTLPRPSPRPDRTSSVVLWVLVVIVAGGIAAGAAYVLGLI